jgi:Zn-dependent protease
MRGEGSPFRYVMFKSLILTQRSGSRGVRPYNARMPELDFAQRLAVWVLPVLLAVTLHEVAHGLAARRLGDRTAEILGRLSLNPLRHIDPVGTILVPLVMLLLPFGVVFGWAKPVPVDPRNFRDPRRGMAYVGAAGPLANLVMLLAWVVVVRLGTLVASGAAFWGGMLVLMGVAGILINAVLMLFNLVPIPPLDGSRVLAGVVSPSSARFLARLEPYGLWIVVLLLITGVLQTVLGPLFVGLLTLVRPLTGLPFSALLAAVQTLHF